MNNQADDLISEDKDDKELQLMPLPSASEATVLLHWTFDEFLKVGQV